jgi:tRNA threonylcarbamoyladenosine modification (KEOPS) complex Cgi121 subunit
MIVRDFSIKDLQLRYYVGINQIILDVNYLLKNNNLTGEKEVLDYIFKHIQDLQDINEDSIIQLISDKYVLSPDHIFIACYYVQKSFSQNTYISNKKNIELLLYLSTYRQINKAIEAFGVDLQDLREGNVLLCIISPVDNIEEINDKILQVFKAKETEISVSNISRKKIQNIIKKYEILDSQIDSVVKTSEESDTNLEVLSSAVMDLIYEKMALLKLEKG